MTRVNLSLPQRRGFGETLRKDYWWIEPTLVFLGFLTFIVYSTWAALQGTHYFLHDNGANYLSPFYAPLIWDAPGQESHFAWFGPWPQWWPSFIPATPALLILWAPGLFRFTCYYYRGAYYKAFWADPLSCSVGEPKFRCENYRGEARLPLIFQNIHRYFMYIAVIFIGLLLWEAWYSLWWTTEDGSSKFGVGVGSVILFANVFLLGGYTFGCHSLRHVIGGWRNAFSKAPVSKKAYDCVSCLNRRHMQWAWVSLFMVGFSDLYIRLCSMGIWTDWRIIG